MTNSKDRTSFPSRRQIAPEAAQRDAVTDPIGLASGMTKRLAMTDGKYADVKNDNEEPQN